MTALIQSSSATTIITIGFVSAGLLTFIQSIGVIIGANIGSTSTSWIISLIGFKVNLNAMSLPIIGVGIFLKTFAPNKFKPYGSILAGAGLLFLGIQTLQDGMTVFDSMLMLDSFVGDTAFHKIVFILIGLFMTVIMQSSSAAIAVTLTALHAGAIPFELAAFLVIGQNIGTTITALLASIGASVSAKRTALTHVLFNLGTGSIAAIFCPLLLALTGSISTFVNGQFDATLGIAIFHTLFNLLGVILFVPFIRPFAHFVMKVIPDKGNPLTRYLDTNVASVPAVALEAAYKTLLAIMKELTEEILTFIQSQNITNEFEKTLQNVEDAIKTTKAFLKLFFAPSSEDQNKHLSILHALDHMDRLVKVLREEQKLEVINLPEGLMNEWSAILKEIQLSIHTDELDVVASLLEETSTKMANERRALRNEYFIQSVRSETELETALSKVQALLWIDRLVYHYWRAIARLTESTTSDDKQKDK